MKILLDIREVVRYAIPPNPTDPGRRLARVGENSILVMLSTKSGGSLLTP